MKKYIKIFILNFIFLNISLLKTEELSEYKNQPTPFVAALHVSKDVCHEGACHDHLIGRHNGLCSGKVFANWDEQKGVCYCSCSEFEGVRPAATPQNILTQTAAYARPQLNIPLRGTKVGQSTVPFVRLPGAVVEGTILPFRASSTANTEAAAAGTRQFPREVFISKLPTITTIGR